LGIHYHREEQKRKNLKAHSCPDGDVGSELWTRMTTWVYKAQGLVEYALIIALIAIVAIIALIFLGGQIATILSQIGESV
jgi:hypothetical protein